MHQSVMTESEQFLLAELEIHLGKSHKKSKENYSFHCPFCNHRKPKLEIDLKTSDKGENPFACWVCGVKGRRISRLLKLLNVPKQDALRTLQFVKKGFSYEYEGSVEEHLELPKEYKPLYHSSDISITSIRIKNYLKSRGIDEHDIRKYQIGYATEGEYQDRLIIPSYNEYGKLNFFIARSIQDGFRNYIKPSVNTSDVIFFESLVNWNKPVILCEGVFDAIAIRKNAIPLLGKYAQLGLKRKLLESRTPAVYVSLDSDAKKEAIKLSEDFTRLGIKTYIITLEGKDPSDIGYINFQKYFKFAEEVDISSIIKQKLQLI